MLSFSAKWYLFDILVCTWNGSVILETHLTLWTSYERQNFKHFSNPIIFGWYILMRSVPFDRSHLRCRCFKSTSRLSQKTVTFSKHPLSATRPENWPGHTTEGSEIATVKRRVIVPGSTHSDSRWRGSNLDEDEPYETSYKSNTTLVSSSWLVLAFFLGCSSSAVHFASIFSLQHTKHQKYIRISWKYKCVSNVCVEMWILIHTSVPFFCSLNSVEFGSEII